MIHPRFSFPLILLAAGASSRMRGRDKLMEQVEGIPLIRRQAEMACNVCSAQILVALPPAPHPRYDVLAGLGVTPVPVPDAVDGMNVSLKATFRALPQNARAAMVLLCDLPDLRADDLSKVANAVDLSSDTLIWRGATSDGLPGHPIVFAAPLFGQFDSLTGDSGGREVVRAAKGRVALIALPDDRARLDLDTPEDWDRWRAAQSKSAL